MLPFMLCPAAAFSLFSWLALDSGIAFCGIYRAKCKIKLDYIVLF